MENIATNSPTPVPTVSQVPPPANPPKTMRKLPRVAVVGAGPAGLSAARTLMHNGIKEVVVFEARGRPGGRVLTARIGNEDMQAFNDLSYNGPRTLYNDPREDVQNVDIGASVMHGCGDDCQYVFRRMIAEKIRAPIAAGGVVYESTEAAVWMDDKGSRISAELITEMHRVYDACIRYIASQTHYDSEGLIDLRLVWNEAVAHFHKTYRNFSDLEMKMLEKIMQRGYGYCAPLQDMGISLTKGAVDPERSVHYHVGVDFDEEEDPPQEGEMIAFDKKAIRKDAEWFEKMLASNDKPTIPLASRRGGTGDRIVIDGYTPSFIDKIKQGIDIRFHSVVQKIERVDDIVEITTRDGAVDEFDYVVCTAPLGVLQNKSSSSQIQFVPQLSEKKRAAINGMGAGVHNKVVLFYDEQFWTKNTPQINCLDMRFQFFNLHAYKKTGVILAHIYAESGFGSGYENKADEEVVEEVQKCLYKMFCSTGKWTTSVPRTMNIVVKGKRYGPPKSKGTKKKIAKQTNRSKSLALPTREVVHKTSSIEETVLEEGAAGDEPVLPSTTEHANDVTTGNGSPVHPSSAKRVHESTLEISDGETGNSASGPTSGSAPRTPNYVTEEEEVLDGSHNCGPVPHQGQREDLPFELAASVEEANEGMEYEMPKPKSYIVTRWDSDPYSLGSYSYLPPGANFSFITEFQVPEKMGTNRDVLYFAGEHASVPGWQCVHGAYESGLIAAHGILVQEGLVTARSRFEDLDEYPPPAPKKNITLDRMDQDDVQNLSELCKEYAQSPGHLYDVLDELIYRIDSKDFESNVEEEDYVKPTASDRKSLWSTMQVLSKEGTLTVRHFMKMRWQLARQEVNTFRTQFSKRRRGKREAGVVANKIGKYVEVLNGLIDRGEDESVLDLAKMFATAVYHSVGAVMPWSAVVSYVQAKLTQMDAQLEFGDSIPLNRESAGLNASKLDFPTLKTFSKWASDAAEEDDEYSPPTKKRKTGPKTFTPSATKSKTGSNGAARKVPAGRKAGKTIIQRSETVRSSAPGDEVDGRASKKSSAARSGTQRKGMKRTQQEEVPNARTGKGEVEAPNARTGNPRPRKRSKTGGKTLRVNSRRPRRDERAQNGDVVEEDSSSDSSEASDDGAEVDRVRLTSRKRRVPVRYAEEYVGNTEGKERNGDSADKEPVALQLRLRPTKRQKKETVSESEEEVLSEGNANEMEANNRVALPPPQQSTEGWKDGPWAVDRG